MVIDNPYPVIPDEAINMPYIAGFAGDIDHPSRIFYKLLSEDDGDRFYQSRAHVLNLLHGGFGGSMAGFNPTHILQVTWDKVHNNNETVSVCLCVIKTC